MKTLFLSMMLCIGAFASDTFRDEDLGLTLQVPEALKQTWNVSNSQTGLAVTVFNTDEVCEEDEENEESIYMAVFGKIPQTDVIGEDFEDYFPVVLKELFEQFLIDEDDDTADKISIEKLSPMTNDGDFFQRFRVAIYIEDLEEMILMDVHAFIKNGHSCFILTAGLNCNAHDNLDDFSEEVFANISFEELETEE